MDHPETELTDDAQLNAHLLRHDLRDRINLVALTAQEMKRTKTASAELLQEWSNTLQRQCTAMLALVVVVRELPKPADPPTAG